MKSQKSLANLVSFSGFVDSGFLTQKRVVKNVREVHAQQ